MCVQVEAMHLLLSPSVGLSPDKPDLHGRTPLMHAASGAALQVPLPPLVCAARAPLHAHVRLDQRSALPCSGAHAPGADAAPDAASGPDLAGVTIGRFPVTAHSCSKPGSSPWSAF